MQHNTNYVVDIPGCLTPTGSGGWSWILRGPLKTLPLPGGSGTSFRQKELCRMSIFLLVAYRKFTVGNKFNSI